MEGISDDMAYGTASVLIVTILLINLGAYAAMNRLTRRYR
jgi:ABC-type phosphate transport system permease subunit